MLRVQVGALRPREDFGEANACGCSHPRAASGPTTGGQNHLPAHVSPVRPPRLLAEECRPPVAAYWWLSVNHDPQPSSAQRAQCVSRLHSGGHSPGTQEAWWADTCESTCGFQPGGEHTGQVPPFVLAPGAVRIQRVLRSHSSPGYLSCHEHHYLSTPCSLHETPTGGSPCPSGHPSPGGSRGNPLGCHGHRGFCGRCGVEGLELLPSSCWGGGGGGLPWEPARCSQRVPCGRRPRGSRRQRRRPEGQAQVHAIVGGPGMSVVSADHPCTVGGPSGALVLLRSRLGGGQQAVLRAQGGRAEVGVASAWWRLMPSRWEMCAGRPQADGGRVRPAQGTPLCREGVRQGGGQTR